MGNCTCCLAKDRAERMNDIQHTHTVNFQIWGPEEMVALDAMMQAQVLEASARSFSSLSHTIMSVSEEPYQPEEDPEDQSIMEEASAAGTLDPSLGPEGHFSVPSTRATSPSSEACGASTHKEGEGTSPSGSESDTDSSAKDVLDAKLAVLIQFLALKYLRKEPATMEEMLGIVSRDYEESFPVLFKEATQCMQLVFGIDTKVQPCGSYVLVPVLGLTYDGMVTNDQGYPRTIFLIIVLGIIYIQGNHAREEAIWEVMSEIGVFPEKEHVIYGEPRKFLTEDLVREQYIICQEVPNSSPPQLEFIWGPRALAETSKKDVLEFLGQLKTTTFRTFPLDEEASSENAE
nr:melanoma-associated antigen 1 [Cavia porcellus]